MERKRSLFKKHSMVKRVLAYMLVFAMVVTMGAFSQMVGQLNQVQAASGDVNVTMHIRVDNNIPGGTSVWTAPAIQFWGGSNTVVSDSISPTGGEAINGWGGAKGYALTEETDGWYKITLKGDFTGFQFVNSMETPDGSKAVKFDPITATGINLCTESTAKDIYCIKKDDKWSFYSDDAGTSALPVETKASMNVTMHICVDENIPGGVDKWTAPAIQFWGGATEVSDSTTAADGQLIKGWGGAKGYALTEETDGWYKITLKGDFAGFQFLNDMQAPDGDNTVKFDPVSKTALDLYREASPIDLYCINKNGKWQFFKDKTGLVNAKPANVTMHICMDSNIPGGKDIWTAPAIQFWGGSAEVSDSTTAADGQEITGWGGARGYELTAEEDGWYKITLKGEFTGFQFLNNMAAPQGNKTVKFDSVSATGILQYADDSAKDVYCIFKDDKWAFYKDNAGENAVLANEPVKEPSECVLTLNFKSSWEHAESYIWNGSEKPAGEWPGKKMTATPGHDGWYSLHLVVDGSKNYECIFNNKLNNDKGTQLDTIALETKDKTAVEYWYDGTTLTTTKPDDWKYTTTVHYLASNMGDKIYTHMWGGDASIAGPGVGQKWPGELATKNADHEGWYDAVYTQDTKTDFGCIFNNNNGTQTDDIKVVVTSTNTEIWVTGTKADSNTKVYNVAPDTWEKGPEPYSFTMYYYNPDLTADDLGKVDLWMWNAGLNGSYVFTDTWYDEENGVTWFKQTITTNDDQIGNTAGLKARYDRTQEWDGGSDTADRSFTISGVENETWYYVDGQNPVSEKPVITPSAPRYFVLDYVNEGLYEKGVTPQFYTWSSGYAAALKDFSYVGDGKWTVTVPVKASCAKVDFVIALDSKGDPWVKDGGDHSVAFPTTQRVVYAKMAAGGEPELAMPYNTGYKVKATDKQIEFYYRDDDAFVAGTLKNMTVAVDINGKDYAMTYNDTTKRFEYTMNGLENGKTYYRYKVGNDYIMDVLNDNAEEYNGADYSIVEYYKLNATITAEVMNKSFNYNENNVVKFTVNQDSTDAKKFKVASASIDVSSLGGSKEMAIEPELQAVAISVTTATALGKKTLPITVVDQYGNEYKTSVEVEVVNRVKKDANDFDWDEAVVYFMLTDRFFDGNTANNTASGANTYGKNEGLYHGGDFAGVTAKLDYLKELGVNTIWITPIVENIAGVQVSGTGSDDVPYNAAYHGYWANDFTKLNPTLGTTTEFQTMINEAHKRGMRIMVDIVINHAGYGTEDNFDGMIRDKSIGEGDILSWQSGMPDFATENADVRAKLVEWQTSWMKTYGVDYFRVDTVKHVESTTWAALKNSTTIVNPAFKMIGEYYGAGYAANGNTLGTGQMDADLDFDFNDQASSFVSGNIASVEKFLAARNAGINNTYMTGQFLSSHDEDGFKQSLINGKGMTKEQATSAALVAATLQLTAKGIPVIYYGEEVGLTGLNNYPYQTNRYDMDFTLANEKNVTYMHYKKMLNIRKEYSAVFARGDRKAVVSSDAEGYDVMSRTYNGTTLYVGMNIKDAAKKVQIPVAGGKNAVYVDLYSDTLYVANKDGKVEVTLPAAKDGGTVVLAPREDIRYIIPVSGDDFSEVVSTIGAVQAGETIMIVPSSTEVIPATVFETLKDKDVTVVIKLEDGYWQINGKSITANKGNIDFGITLGSTAVPADTVKAIADGKQTMQLSLKHNGEFGMKATLFVNVGVTYANKFANLYYYNETKKALEHSQSVKVAADGYVGFEFSHASDYVIVFSDESMAPVSSPQTSDASPIVPISVAIVFVLGAAAVGFGIYRRKRSL